MIYWFSGTGNSRFVAEKLAELTNDTAQNIFMPYTEEHDGIVGLVFPVYVWMPPFFVSKFIDNFLQNIAPQTYKYVVMTCGDDVGKTLDLVKKHGFVPDGAYSLFMPNTYVCLPGFDVDGDKVRQDKLGKSLARISHIAQEVNDRRKTVEIHEGLLPRTKTYLLGKLFGCFVRDDKRFRAGKCCNSCGACTKACPAGNITIGNGQPQWGGNCTGCLACYHTCPKHAIDFARRTSGKGQYLFRRHAGETGKS